MLWRYGEETINNLTRKSEMASMFRGVLLAKNILRDGCERRNGENGLGVSPDDLLNTPTEHIGECPIKLTKNSRILDRGTVEEKRRRWKETPPSHNNGVREEDSCRESSIGAGSESET